MGSVTTAASAPALELPHSARSRSRVAAAMRWIEPHALLVPVVAVYAIGLLLNLPNGVASDTWLALVSGREVAQHGLPAHDVLILWSHGRGWIDQQWGAQLAFYWLYRLGSFKFMLFAFAALNVITFVLVLAVARWRGGSQRSVLWLSLPCIFLLGWTSWVVRPQTFAYLLFVGLLWLLIADSRNPSRRVFLVLPLLVLWENLHGTAVLATLLVGLRAV